MRFVLTQVHACVQRGNQGPRVHIRDLLPVLLRAHHLLRLVGRFAAAAVRQRLEPHRLHLRHQGLWQQHLHRHCLRCRRFPVDPRDRVCILFLKIVGTYIPWPRI